MRQDALGLFWRDEPPPPKVKKQKVKRTPPEPVWLADDYYPHLDEALAMQYDCMTDKELMAECIAGTVLEFDIEVYKNYTLIGFRTYDERRKYIIFELIPDEGITFNTEKLKWVMNNFVTSGFNNKAYDNPMVALAIMGLDSFTLKEASDKIIAENIQAYIVLRHYKCNPRALGYAPKFIDLMNVAPRSATLKKYAGRVGIRQMQDLPFPPEATLDKNKRAILKWYWANDLASNEILHDNLTKQIDMRVKMGAMYNVELRDKSDAQIAETIFASEKLRLTRDRANKVDLDKYRGTVFTYEFPAYIKFHSATMREIESIVRDAKFYINYDARVEAPVLEKLTFVIGDTTYKIGIGGLHSQEKSRYYITQNGWILKDHDVTSYYPNLILTLGMYPEAIGPIFLTIYQTLKDNRVVAKKRQKDAHKLILKLRAQYGDNMAAQVVADINKLLDEEDDAKVLNESGKIIINGSFGKFGDPWSVLYAPNLLIQTTLTGQLSILMLIERLELAGIKVVSANTDGLVTYQHETQEDLMQQIIAQWQQDTGMELEHTEYKGLFSRDVNAYFAIKADGEVKGKGAFAQANLELDPKYEICADAVKAWCSTGASIEHTVRSCVDLSKFVMIKSVKTGAVQGTQYLGKTVRYYKSTDDLPEIVMSKSGNLVPMSAGCRECMLLPDSLPEDLDYEWYIEESYRMLEGVGVDYNALTAA